MSAALEALAWLAGLLVVAGVTWAVLAMVGDLGKAKKEGQPK